MIERILKLIAQTKLSDNAFEKQLGFSQGTIGNWRNGRNKLSYEAIIKLARHFNISADYLLCLSDEPTPLKTADIAENSNYALSTELAELSQDERFIDSAKIYKELPNKYREEVYALIRGIAIGVGLNLQQILGRKKENLL